MAHSDFILNTDNSSLQADVERIQPRLSHLQELIQSEKNIQLHYIKEFEKTLMDISSELYNARDFYKKSKLLTEIDNINKACIDLEQQVKNSAWDIQTLTRCLEKLLNSESLYSVSDMEIASSLSVCISALQRDEKDAQLYLNEVREKLKEIHDILYNTP